MLVTDDDGPAGREPTAADLFVPNLQSWITNYLDVRNAQYVEGKFTDLKEKAKSGGFDQFA